eukprot:9513461-Karenia_brevis.AAC.1
MCAGLQFCFELMHSIMKTKPIRPRSSSPLKGKSLGDDDARIATLQAYAIRFFDEPPKELWMPIG